MSALLIGIAVVATIWLAQYLIRRYYDDKNGQIK